MFKFSTLITEFKKIFFSEKKEKILKIKKINKKINFKKSIHFLM